MNKILVKENLNAEEELNGKSSSYIEEGLKCKKFDIKNKVSIEGGGVVVSKRWDVYESIVETFDGVEYEGGGCIGEIIQYDNNFLVTGLSEAEFYEIMNKLPIDLNNKENLYNVSICELKQLLCLANPENEVYQELFSEEF
jgi:hypothetical protein